MKPPPFEIFQKQLRSALNHLYDPEYLRQSPLSELLNVADKFDTPMLLQRILTEAIESLHPNPDISVKSQAWNTYNILLFRYSQQLNQEEVATQLGVSPRQLAREQEVALEMLAFSLWERYHLGHETGDEEKEPGPLASPVEDTENIAGDLNWLSEKQQDQPADLGEAIRIVLDLVDPLIQRYAEKLKIGLAENLPCVAMHPVGLRQALLSIMNVTINHAVDGEITIQVAMAGQTILVQIEGKGKTAYVPSPAEDDESLKIVHVLMDLCKGNLEVSAEENYFKAALSLPAMNPVTVLVIDDNADLLQLMNRFVMETRYKLVQTRVPGEALDLVEKHSPQIIILDVMMPEMDGWQMLGKLRQHPLTSHIPIVICTIVAQEELAYALGASAYIHKPVTRELLLSTLDLLSAQAPPKSR